MTSSIILAFILGWFSSWSIREIWGIIQQIKRIYAKIKEIEVENNKCINGYEDWDDCPVCRHQDNYESDKNSRL